MTVEIRERPTRANAGDVINPAANTATEQIAGSQLMDWCLQGYIYTAGSVLMDATDIASVTTLADTTPTYALQSPTGTDTVVIPLKVRAVFTDDGGGISTLNLVYTKAKAESATALSFSGTALKISNNYTPNPQATAVSTMQYTVTSGALTNVDCNVIAQAQLVDAGITTGLIQLNEVFEYSFKHNPIALVDGAALLLYTYSAGGAGRTRVTFTWAEIPGSIYIP